MDSYLSNNQIRANIFDPPPILIAADTESAQSRALATGAMTGFRVADAVAIEGAVQRLRWQAAASALWIEIDRDTSAATQDLLEQVADDVGQGRYAAVIAASGRLLDSL